MLIPRNYLLTLCMLAPFTLLGQSQIPYDIPTPNTASLGKYGFVPVSLYTGVPDISIPLYDLTVRNVTLPLRLRYEASGLQINSLPGWLGHNWSLEAGGVITRTVKGRYDDYIVTNPQYLHEYGHTFDSRLFAQYYLFTIGIPSLLSAMTSKEINTPPFSTHQEYWTEKRANRWAKRYFGKYYGVNWDTDIYNNYSYEKLYPTY